MKPSRDTDRLVWLGQLAPLPTASSAITVMSGIWSRGYYPKQEVDLKADVHLEGQQEMGHQVQKQPQPAGGP